MSLSSDPSVSMNHIFVDFENVQQVDLSLIGKKALSFTLLLGAQQARIDANLVEKLLQHAAQVQFIRLASPGRNALDFALAYYVGRAVMADPGGSFHIVSRDTGYDPLVEHLRSRNVQARRYDDFSRLPFAAPLKPALSVPLITPVIASVAAPTAPPPRAPVKASPLGEIDPLVRLLDRLRKNEKNRPKSRKSLLGYLRTTGGSIPEAEAMRLLERLEQGGHVRIGDKGQVSYPEKKSAAFPKPPSTVPPPKPRPAPLAPSAAQKAPPPLPPPPSDEFPSGARRSMWGDSDCFPF